jgi:hypothetical protein
LSKGIAAGFAPLGPNSEAETLNYKFQATDSGMISSPKKRIRAVEKGLAIN